MGCPGLYDPLPDVETTTMRCDVCRGEFTAADQGQSTAETVACATCLERLLRDAEGELR